MALDLNFQRSLPKNIEDMLAEFEEGLGCQVDRNTCTIVSSVAELGLVPQILETGKYLILKGAYRIILPKTAEFIVDDNMYTLLLMTPEEEPFWLIDLKNYNLNPVQVSLDGIAQGKFAYSFNFFANRYEKNDLEKSYREGALQISDVLIEVKRGRTVIHNWGTVQNAGTVFKPNFSFFPSFSEN